MLLGYALMQGLIVLRLLPWIRKQAFGPGYWAFTFGVADLALGAELLVSRGATGPAAVLAPMLFVVANLVVGSIAIGSIAQLARELRATVYAVGTTLATRKGEPQ